jgi:hypothetical protein
LEHHRFVGAALPGKHRVQGLDRFARTHEAGDLHELAEELTAEHAVVLEMLVTAFEQRRIRCSSGPVYRGGLDVEALE